MSYPWIARPSRQRRRLLPRETMRLRQLRVAMLLALSGAMLLPGRSAHAAAPLPVPVIDPANAANVANFGTATVTQTTTAMQINQTTDKAIINWNSFSIDAGHSVNFQQPGASSVTLNRVTGNATSNIMGKLTANGQIFLINQNGILFATGATVNVNSLTASTLDIGDDVFKSGILSPSSNAALTPVFSGSGTEGDVTVDANAQLTAQSGGRIMLVAPNVHNQGLIKAPDGQIILAAGAKVYLQASDDPGLRGLLVEVDSTCGNDPNCTTGNVAENLGGTKLGELLAQRGNVTLVGLAVNQSGRVSATTSVNANGSIELLAQTDPTRMVDTSATLGYRAQATRTGTVTIGADSVTEVTPELNDPTTVVDEQTVLPSKITAVGHTVDVQHNSRITANSGLVTFSATADTANLDPSTRLLNGGSTADGSRVYIDQGASIDVSGIRNVALPMSHNLVQVQLRSNELADSPLQRNGILNGQTVTVDARVGTPLANVSGAVAGIGRSIAERTTSGGTVNIQSTGDVVINPGATIDVSGGSKLFQGGYLNTTQLISNGVNFDIGGASPDRTYTGIAGVFTKSYTAWNVNESWGIVGPAAGSTAPYVPGYTEGADAGTLNINTFRLVQNGTLLGNAIAGSYQRGVRPADASRCDLGCQASTAPHGGQLLLGDPDFTVNTQAFSRIGDVVFGNGFTPGGIGLEDARLGAGDPIPATQLDTAFLDNGGFTRLAVFSDGLISLPQDTALSTAPGGSIGLAGRQIDIAGDIKTSGGSVHLDTRQVADEAAGSNHDISIGTRARIDVAGVWANDLPQGQSPATLASTAINGGSVAVNAYGNFDLATGSLLDVSGAAWLNSNGKLTLGKGGNVTLGTSQPDTGMTLAGTLRGYAPGTGGSVSLTAGSVCISASACDGMTNPLLLDPAFFQQGGFSRYVVTANVNGLTVADNTQIAPLAQNLLIGGNYSKQTNGSDIYGFSTITTLPNGQRAPVDITLRSNSTGAAVTGPESGILTLSSGSGISGDTGASISLESDRSMEVEGTLSAPAGNITLRVTPPPGNLDQGFDAGQSIWLGADSALLAKGITQLIPDSLGFRQGQVLSGGTVTLDAQRGYVIAKQGARVDVSGTTGTLDLSQGNGSYLSTSIASAGGTVNISTAEGLLWDGAVDASSGAPSVLGGTLNVSTTRANAGTGCQYDGNCNAYPNPFPGNARSIVLQNSSGEIPAGLRPNDPVPDTLDGQALLDNALLNNSGFDNITLTSDRSILFQDNTSLALRGRLRLDAPQIVVANDSQVSLSADYVGLGASATLNQEKGGAVPDPSAGNGSLAVHAPLIDLIGDLNLSGVSDTRLLSGGDLRLRGVLSHADNFNALDGAFKLVGNLSLQADQIYPTSFSNYTVSLQSPGSTLTVQPGGETSPVLSAAGAVSFAAPNIVDNGVIKAPLGSITLDGTDSLQLAAGSLTSTSAEGQTIPFGIVQNGSNWSYDFGNGNQAQLPAPPAKRINLSGDNVAVDNGATLDLSGGGDLLGYEFVPGPGGGKDVLSAGNAPGTYAILPTLTAGEFRAVRSSILCRLECSARRQHLSVGRRWIAGRHLYFIARTLRLAARCLSGDCGIRLPGYPARRTGRQPAEWRDGDAGLSNARRYRHPCRSTLERLRCATGSRHDTLGVCLGV